MKANDELMKLNFMLKSTSYGLQSSLMLYLSSILMAHASVRASTYLHVWCHWGDSCLISWWCVLIEV